MKTLSVFILASLLLASVAYSKDLQITKKAGEYTIEVRIDRNPPILGNNHVEIQIKDAGGKPVTDAKILLNYYMPPMPRMAPMNYKVKAKLEGEKYVTKMVLIMSGPWFIVPKIEVHGKRLSVKINIDVP